MSELFDRMTQGGYETVTRYVELSDPDKMMDDILALDELAESHYADTKKTNKVYIGYIGRHLTNTRTN